MSKALDLSPARWIWAPYGRTLPNTFVLFRREITVAKPLLAAKGWILADSRYLLSVNGQRVQFGPAPSDPRYEEADPMDLTAFLRQGENVLGVRVVYFGHGDGTWVSGRPGLIFKLILTYADGTEDTVVSDVNTQWAADESHPAGQYKRWYLRALQEEYDARKDAIGFDTAEFACPERFEPAKVLPGSPKKPSSLNGGGDYLYDGFPAEPEDTCIRARRIPMPREEHISAARLSHSDVLHWKHDPDDWFRFRREGCFEIVRALDVDVREDSFSFMMPEEGAVCLTFKLPEGACGFIDYRIEAPEGTVVEAIVQEGHKPENTHWLDTQFYAWSRMICSEGENHFVSFDYECFAWLQLHIHNASGKIMVRAPGILRRTAPVDTPILRTNDDSVDAVLSAALNTLRNSAIETFVDGMARERQQYSGDGNHQVALFSYLYGADHPMVHRYYETFGDGLTKDGYFMDSWPAYDRMNRIAQVQIGMTEWAPILDHSITFVSEYCRWRFESGDHSLDTSMIPKFKRLAAYLATLCEADGTVRSVRGGNTWFWIDVDCFRCQEDKQCVVNLHVYDMLKNALVPLLRAYDEPEADALEAWSRRIRKAIFARWYDETTGLLYDNLPRTACAAERIVSDRTLAAALLYDLFDDPEPALKALCEMPVWVLPSYPANAVWRMKALGQYGRAEAITSDLKTKWYAMSSVGENNTLQEAWTMHGDAPEEWSHCPIGPALALYESYAGLRCEADGFRAFSVRPQSGGLEHMEWSACTPSGNIRYVYDHGTFRLDFPNEMRGWIRRADGTELTLISGKEYGWEE